jgi:glutathionylspermidine synthase
MTAAPETTPEVRLAPIPAPEYGAFRREVIFSCCKWDPQVGDVNTIADSVVVLSAAAAGRLSAWAEALAAETLAAELELARRPDLWRELALPWPVRRALAAAAGRAYTGGVRVMRFDLHPTSDGWAVSEVNSDVPGGFAEASALARLATRFVAGSAAWGDVGQAVAAGFAAVLAPGARVALVHATAYADDRQVMQFLGEALAVRGLIPLLVAPDHLRWPDGRVQCIAREQQGEVAGVVRFFPVEWLPLLPRAADWRGYFRHSVPCCNHATAILTQSKRLPLLWERLGQPASTWRQLLPETRDPRQADWRRDRDWILKPALGRVGEAVTIPEVTPASEWRRISWSARLCPRDWVAQRRFQSRLLASPRGGRHLGLGVFTVNGRACGFYGRLADRPRIDQYAQDVAVVVQQTAGKDGQP